MGEVRVNVSLDAGVLYMLTGAKHGVVLAVSLWSLRRYYRGPVAIAAGDDAAAEVAGRLADDPRLGPVVVVRWAAERGGRKGLQYAHKTLMSRLSPFRRTIFLDADTLVCGPLAGLWPADGEVRLTRFADWTTQGRAMTGRLEAWRGALPAHVARSLDRPWPAINTGVLSWERGAQAWHDAWRMVTLRNVSFICDEIAAQLLVPLTDPARLVVLDDRYNASPVHSAARLAARDAFIWHGHGFKFIRREAGRALWLPCYRAAVRENVGGLAEWTPGHDRHLARWRAAEGEAEVRS